MNKTSSMILSDDDSNILYTYGKKAYDNDTYEFEALLNNPIVSKESFTRVINMCKNKTCYNSWKCIRDKSKSLDISIGEYRVTINGKESIEQYAKTESLDNLSREVWSVCKKKRVKLNNVYASYIMSIGCKLNLKEEISVNPDSQEFSVVLASWANKNKTFRLKNRYSYLAHSKYSVDLTVIRTKGIECKTLKQSETLYKDARETYEVEVEYYPSFNTTIRHAFDIESWKTVIEELLCVLRNTWKIADLNTLKDVENEYFYTLANDTNLSLKKNGYEYKLGPKVVSLSLKRLRTMTKQIAQYFVTPKSDGLRVSVFICTTGEAYIFGDKSTELQPTGCFFESSTAGSVFDAELILQTKTQQPICHILIFDCYFSMGNDIRSESFLKRLNIATDIVNKINPVLSTTKCLIKVKNFMPCGSMDTFHNVCKDCFDEIENDIYENDGLIFTPIDKVGGDHLYEKQSSKFIKSGYEFPKMLKWKDISLNSIDFRIKFGQTIEERLLKLGDDYIMTKYKICKLFVVYNEKSLPFTYHDFINSSKDKHKINTGSSFEAEFKPYFPEDVHAHQVKLPIIDNKIRCKNGTLWNGPLISDNDIVEMVFDKDSDIDLRWTPIRIRKDKEKPNFYKVAQDIWKSYYAPVTKNIMIGIEPIPTSNEEDDNYYNNDASISKSKYRFFHRQVKGHIFEESIFKTQGKRLLDIGSGKGGDLPRYFEYGLTVVGVDNSEDNLHNSENGAYRRLKQRLDKDNSSDYKKIQFIAGDARKSFLDSNTFHGEYKNIVQDQNIFSTQHTFDGATIFFALHYFCESQNTFMTFLQNVGNNVKVGGYFAGCCYDGSIIFKEFQNEKNMDLVYKDETGTELLRIQKKYNSDTFESNVSSLGKEIKVLVQSIGEYHSEYLVNFEFLQKELYALGFELVSAENFKDYYINKNNGKKQIILSTQEQDISFLNKAFIYKRTRIGKIENIRVKALKEPIQSTLVK